MLTEFEKEVIAQVNNIEQLQRDTMKEINAILRSIVDLSIEGEDQNPDLKNANDRMKFLIFERISLLKSIGATDISVLPDNIEPHFLG